MTDRTLLRAMIVLCGLPAPLLPPLLAQTTYSETEPNDSKIFASGPFVLAAGDAIQGTSISSSGAGIDTFLLRTGAAPAGIYRHRLVITSGTAHAMSIRGRDQTAGIVTPSSDGIIQTGATTPQRAVAWYGFGRSERLYVAVTGTSSTTAPYTAALETAPVLPTPLGTLPGGHVTISTVGQGHTTDTKLWVYDANLTAIPEFGNDNEPAPGTTTQSRLARDFAPGTYYLAVSISNTANQFGQVFDDRDQSDNVMDFPDVLVNSVSTVTTGNSNVSFVITDGAGLDHPTPAARTEQFGINWYTFTLTAPVAPTGSCCRPDSICYIATGPGCAANGHVYQGDGTVCANTDCPPPGGCCFPDYSCRILSVAQCTAAGGVSLGIGSACTCTPPPVGSVAIVAAANTNPAHAQFLDVQSKLQFTGAFPEVVIFNAARGTPTLQYLQQFKAVITWSNVNYFEADLLGDALADYVDAGGGVVVTPFANSSNTPYRWLLGRWTPYEIIPSQGGSTGTSTALGGILIPGHPVIDGVSTLSGTNMNRPTTTAVNAHGQKVALWQDGRTLAAVSTEHPRRVDLGLYPPSADTSAGFWTGDGARLMANALLYAGRPLGTPCYANCDNSTQPPILNVSDFGCFLTKYAAGDPYANCDASTQAPVLNVSDFGCFLTQYAAGCR
ncbi:MAG: hypothetical protein WD749_00840 [Phycisphaerales bacterium]